MKDGSQRREPETSVFVLIARRMEPEPPGSSPQRPLGPSSRVAFCYLPVCLCPPETSRYRNRTQEDKITRGRLQAMYCTAY